MHSNLSMLTLLEKALSISEAILSQWGIFYCSLWSYRHRKGIRTGKCHLTSSAVKRMISKFEAIGCLADRPRSGRPSASANVAWAVQEEMEIVANSPMHGKVSAHEVARRIDILYTTVWVALQRTLLCHPYKIQRHYELLPCDFVK